MIFITNNPNRNGGAKTTHNPLVLVLGASVTEAASAAEASAVKVLSGSITESTTADDIIDAVLIPKPPIPSSDGDGGRGQMGGRHDYDKEEREKRRKREEEDNRFIIEFLKTATDIINNQ